MINQLTLIFTSFFLCLQMAGASEKLKDLRHGDLLLVELPCLSCQYIASETQSRFSHSGLVMENPQGELVVVESLGVVEHVPLRLFIGRGKPGSLISVMRSPEQELLQRNEVKEKFWQDYLDHWRGLPFDREFLWDNHNEAGEEFLYCSEMIYKFLAQYLVHPPGSPTPMDYSRHFSFWRQYFQGEPPQGKLGNSPASFANDPIWYQAFEIEAQ